LKPFAAVAEEVEQRWADRERRERIATTVEKIRTAINEGATFQEAASAYDRAPIEMTIDRRFQNDAISREFNEKVFFAGLNEVVAGAAGGSGAQIVARINEIGYGRNAISPAEVDNLALQMGLQLDQELIEAFVASVREDYGVNVNQAQIEALFADGF